MKRLKFFVVILLIFSFTSNALAVCENERNEFVDKYDLCEKLCAASQITATGGIVGAIFTFGLSLIPGAANIAAAHNACRIRDEKRQNLERCEAHQIQLAKEILATAEKAASTKKKKHERINQMNASFASFKTAIIQQYDKMIQDFMANCAAKGWKMEDPKKQKLLRTTHTNMGLERDKRLDPLETERRQTISRVSGLSLEQLLLASCYTQFSNAPIFPNDPIISASNDLQNVLNGGTTDQIRKMAEKRSASIETALTAARSAQSQVQSLIAQTQGMVNAPVSPPPPLRSVEDFIGASIQERNTLILNEAKAHAVVLKALFEALPQAALPSWTETVKSFFGYSNIDKALIKRIEINHNQVMNKAHSIRVNLSFDNVLSHLSIEAREYILSEVEVSEQMSQIALRSAELGGDRRWIDVLSQYATDSINAIADFETGLAKGFYNGFYGVSETMYQVFRNPQLLSNFPKAIMHAITDPTPLLAHLKDAFIQFNLKLITGSTGEKGTAIGELAGDVLLALATDGVGRQVVEHLTRHVAQKGLLEATGAQLLTEMRSIEKLGPALTEFECTAKTIVESAGEIIKSAPKHVLGQVKDVEAWQNIVEFLGNKKVTDLNPFTGQRDANRIFSQQENSVWRSLRFGKHEMAKPAGKGMHYHLEEWTAAGEVIKPDVSINVLRTKGK